MKKDFALIERISTALKIVLAASGSSLPMPSGVDVLSKELGKAISETYDSKEDPIVIAAIAASVGLGSNVVKGQMAIPAGTSFTFIHNLGYVPHVTVVRDNGALWWGVTDLTDTTVTIYSDHPSGNTGTYRVICS